MRKIGKYIAILLLVCSYLMVGCGNNSEKTKLVSLDKVREEIPSVLEDIKNGEYSNLAIDDIDVSITNSNKIYNLKLERKDNFFNDREKFVREVPNILKYLLQYDNIDVTKIRDCNNKERNYESISADVGEEDLLSPIVIEYQDEERYCFFTASLNSIWVNRGNIKKQINNSTEHGSDTFVPENYDIVKTYFIYGKEDLKKEKYNLIDGECSVKEAIDYVENYYNNEFKYSFKEDLSIEIFRVDVIKPDENTYGYYMHYRRKHNEIPFDTIKNGAFTYDNLTKSFDIASVLISNKDYIDFMQGVYPNQIVKKEDNEIDKIISLDTVIKSISDKLTSETLFNITSIELIYSINPTDKYEEAILTWKIVATNSNDKGIVYIYCDILTGEVSTFTIY